MSDTHTQIEKQLANLKTFIQDTIDANYVYIDVPLYGNVGDWLIAMGAWELLQESPYKCLGRLRWEDYERVEITPGTIIVLQGGGNFGDLWRGATEARNGVIKRYPNNKIVILSQTITYMDETLLSNDARLYSKHSYLHICARDKESYELAQKYFWKNHVYMMPDTAIGLYSRLPKYDGTKSKKVLIINRKDKEVDSTFKTNGEVKDWEDILDEIHFEWVYFPYRIIRKIRKIIKKETLLCAENWYTLNILYPYMRKHIPKYFLQYENIKTTRLHGYLLGVMLHLPVEIKDNKYHKLTNYINTWMQ